MRLDKLGWLLVVGALTWHLWWVVSPPDAGGGPLESTLGRDFASYYYAGRVAALGGDPYDADALSAEARRDRTRSKVHPWFYPPPALLLLAWTPGVDLEQGYAIWYWLQEISLLLSALALWRWWRPLGTAVPVAIAAWIALLWGIPYGLVMGQINPMVLLLVIGGLWAVERDRPLVGGAAMGFACMVKMSPALLVAWWIVQRRWRAVGAAIGAAIVLSIATLPWVGLGTQVRFYTEILPRFGTGDYNGLIVQIGMFANHSAPNLFDQLWPGDGRTLSDTARMASTATALGLVALLGVAFRTPTRDPWRVAAQASAILVATLLIPVYTYEHHLLVALPAAALSTVALVSGRLPGPLWVVLGAVAVALAWPHPQLKQLATGPLAGSAGAWAVQEMKTAALLVLLGLTGWVGSTGAKGGRPTPR